MKCLVILLATMLGTCAVWGQAQTPPPADSVISAPAPGPKTGAGRTAGPGPNTAPGPNAGQTAETGQAGSGFLAFTNPAGGTFSVQQLDSQLQSLQAAVEEALPMLSAFNQQFGGDGKGSISEVLSRVFSGSGNGKAAQDQGAVNTATNWVGVLGRLFNTNSASSSSSAGMNRSTIEQLSTLEKDLEPVAQVLRSMNLSGAPGGGAPAKIGRVPGAETNQVTGSTNYNDGRLTPTGRQ